MSTLENGTGSSAIAGAVRRPSTSQSDLELKSSNQFESATSGEIDSVSLLLAYRQMLVSLFLSALIFIALFTLIFWSSMFPTDGIRSSPSPVMVSILAGSLGAIFSSLLRLYNFRDLPQALVRAELRELRSYYLLIYSLVPIIIGSIASGLVYVIISATLLQGPLFPTFLCKSENQKCIDFYDLTQFWGPAASIDYAKMLVWGFIAGFAERLVPNSLNTLADSAKPGSK